MAYALRTFTCATCGQPVERRAKRGSEVRCIDCAVQRSVINAHQQRSKSGLFYDRWAASMMAAAREAETISAIGNEINSIGLSNKRMVRGTPPLTYVPVTYGVVVERIS